MKERVTFILPPGAQYDPSAIEIDADGVLGPRIPATREDRLTLSLDELPAPWSRILETSFADLSVRWAGAHSYEPLDPYSSRISPGLHLQYATSDPSDLPLLCEWLSVFGPLDCHDSAASTPMTPMPSSSTSRLVYQELEFLDGFVKNVTPLVCAQGDAICTTRLRSLLTASSLDITYSGHQRQVQLTALWPLRTQAIAVPDSPGRRVEVGILGKDVLPKQLPSELGLAGLLVVPGEHQGPTETSFSFPARHRQADASFSATFLQPTGLHPTLQLKVSSLEAPEEEGCRPYAYLTLPKTIFADRYQFDDELFLASKNLSASRYQSSHVDLEAPAYTTKPWGSQVLLELAQTATSDVTAEIPLHLRYLEPSDTDTTQIQIPYPALFWACESDTAMVIGSSPFDRRELGYDALFSDSTTFWHIAPKPEDGSRLLSSVQVPVLQRTAGPVVELGTTVAIALGFAWVLWKLGAAYMSNGYQRRVPRGQAKKAR